MDRRNRYRSRSPVRKTVDTGYWDNRTGYSPSRNGRNSYNKTPERKYYNEDHFGVGYSKLDMMLGQNKMHSNKYSSYDIDEIRDPSVCNYGSSQQQNESSKNPSETRLAQLEKMVEVLLQGKSQSSTMESNVEGARSQPFITSLWLNKINSDCLEKNYDDVKCINYMAENLSGIMKAWFKTLNPYEYTWPEMKMLITKTFPDTIDFADTLHMLVRRVKKPDETITQYYFSKMFLLEACKISGQNAVSCLIDGLQDFSLQKEANKYNYLTPESLYADYFMKLPDFGITSRDTRENFSTEYEIGHNYGSPKDRLGFEFTKNDAAKNKCFTCGKVGHYAEVCYFSICYHCGRKGHIAANCYR